MESTLVLPTAVVIPFLPTTLAGWALVLKDACTALALIVGGGWAYWRFVLQREARAKIEFNVDLKVIGQQNKTYVIEVVALMHNRGLVRHRVQEFYFDLRYLTSGDDFEQSDDRINHQFYFKNDAVVKRSWIPSTWYATFVDPGVTQRYAYVTYLPIETSFALLHAHFKYPVAEREIHTVQRAFKIETQNYAVVANDG